MSGSAAATRSGAASRCPASRSRAIAAACVEPPVAGASSLVARTGKRFIALSSAGSTCLRPTRSTSAWNASSDGSSASALSIVRVSGTDRSRSRASISSGTIAVPSPWTMVATTPEG